MVLSLLYSIVLELQNLYTLPLKLHARGTLTWPPVLTWSFLKSLVGNSGSTIMPSIFFPSSISKEPPLLSANWSYGDVIDAKGDDAANGAENPSESGPSETQ